MRKKAIILGTCIILFVGALSTRMGRFQAGTDAEVTDAVTDAYDDYYSTVSPEENVLSTVSPAPEKKEEKYIEVDTRPDSYTVLVNRDYLISKDYVPADLVVPDIPFSYYGVYEKSYMRKRAASALEDLFAAAREAGYTLKGVSGYRSYERQAQIYNNNVKTRGEEATNKVSAMPGSSEHQTGLAIDVSAASVGCALEESFGKTAEGRWLKKNCYRFGFIIRYPKNKSKITGYSYEPWHIRYVGPNLAKYLKKNNMTLEEYYKLTTVENKVSEDIISDTDTEIANDQQMTTAPTPKPTIVPTAAPTYAPAVETSKPTKKPKPAVTNTATPEPTAEPTPEVTKYPETTKKPAVTSVPEVTAEPVVTEPPVSESENTTAPAEE